MNDEKVRRIVKIVFKYVLLATAFLGLMILLIANLDLVGGVFKTITGILTPFFIGFLLAYILNFPYKFLYTKAFRKMGAKHKFFKGFRKPLALIITYVGTFAVIGALLVLLVPQIINNLSNLVRDFPTYYKSIENSLQDNYDNIMKMHIPYIQELSYDDIFSGISSFFTGSQDITKTVLSWLQSFVSNFATGIYNSLMGVVISIYFLIYKEQLCRQIKKLAVAFIPVRYLPKVYEIVDITDTKCGRFLVGDILDAGLIGLIFFVVLSIFHFPYASLIAVLCGVANIIPFFGPFIGAIPSAFILLLIDPWLALWFIVITFVIQQIDGNVLKPKIIGNQVGLSSFWVLFSVIVGGALFGVMGFILGTPIYAVIYTLIGKKARNRIEDKGKIAKEALDFKVLNYTEIAEEQKRIRAEKEHEQRLKLKKLIHFGADDEETGEDGEETEETEDTAADENFHDAIHKHHK